MIEAVADPTPFPFWQAAILFKKVHRIWQVVIRVPTYTNPDNFFGLGVGYGIDLILGQNRLLKLPAVPFLVGVRLLDLFEQEDTFRKSCHSWLEGVKAVQPITIIEYAADSWQFKAKWIYIRISRVASATLHVFKESFTLIMRIMDLMELISFDSKQLQELVDLSVKEGALNISRCIRSLNRNKGALIKRLEKNEGTINRLLKGLGAKKTRAEDVVAKIKGGVETLHSWTMRYEAVSQTVGSFFTGQKKKDH